MSMPTYKVANRFHSHDGGLADTHYQAVRKYPITKPFVSTPSPEGMIW